MSPPPGQWIPIPELSDEFDCAGPEPTLRYRDEHASFETPGSAAEAAAESNADGYVRVVKADGSTAWVKVRDLAMT